MVELNGGRDFASFGGDHQPLDLTQSGVGAAELADIGMPFIPHAGVVSEEFLDLVGDYFGGGRESAAAVLEQELRIAFLLARDDLGNDHGCAGCDGFLDSGAAGL